MVQMGAEFLISMTTRRDMEISLDFVHVQAAEDSATVRGNTVPPSRRLRKFRAPSTTSSSNDIMHMLLPKSLIMVTLSGNQPALGILPQSMHALGINPLIPVRRIPLQHICRQYPVARRILNIDVEIHALHLDHDVQIDLEVVPDALLNRECVRLVPPPPACEFR